jgi:thiol-disulfide isomerase/thioredoxin
MRFRTYASWLLPLGAFLNIWSAGETSADKHWSEFKTARQAHQEFEITRKVKTGYVDQVSRHQVTIDVSQDRWREQSTGGAGDLVRIFDGQNLFLTELEGTEYARLKTKAENEETLPGPYAAKLEWRKAKEIQRLPCGFKERDHACVFRLQTFKGIQSHSPMGRGKPSCSTFGPTWCPPCQNDSPAIDKLNQKYGGKDWMIIGISVDEERETVEKYLKKHPHSFPVVLSSENPLPRPYQIGVFPTYLVIGADGTLISAEEGDQGFGKLRKTLEKAGMSTD